MRFRFEENNSGGDWWLEAKHYEALRAAGWVLDESTRREHDVLDTKDVPYDWRVGHTLEVPVVNGDKDAAWEVAEKSWEEATGCSLNEFGCECCGPPFRVYAEPG